MTVGLQTKTINWDAILETYGPETKNGLTQLLTEADIPESDPAAVLIAAMFISQIDTNRAYQSVAATLEEGKASISQEMMKHIEQLRGIVSFAEESLVSGSKEQLEKSHRDMMTAIRTGVTKAIGRESSNRHKRSTLLGGAMMVGAGIAMLAGLLVGGGGIYAVMRSTQPNRFVTTGELASLPNGRIWLEVAQSNQEQLAMCLQRAVELENRCAISVPSPQP